jgi:hypothetical protein
MHVQVTGSVAAVIAEWLEIFKTIISATNWRKESEPREPRFINAKLTPRITVILEKLSDTQLVKKFSAFYDTRTFIIVFTRGHHSCLGWARRIQSTFFTTYFSIILPSMSRSSKWSLTFKFPHQNLAWICLHVPRVPLIPSSLICPP